MPDSLLRWYRGAASNKQATKSRGIEDISHTRYLALVPIRDTEKLVSCYRSGVIAWASAASAPRETDRRNQSKRIGI